LVPIKQTVVNLPYYRVFTPSFRTSGKNLLIHWGVSSIWIITNFHNPKSVSSDGDIYFALRTV